MSACTQGPTRGAALEAGRAGGAGHAFDREAQRRQSCRTRRTERNEEVQPDSYVEVEMPLLAIPGWRYASIDTPMEGSPMVASTGSLPGLGESR